jgi:molybdopterin-binding protein
MVAPVKLNFKIYQGSTFREVLRWESSTKVYTPITGATKTAPLVVTAAGHGMPAGWRCSISNVVGMKELNSLGTIIGTDVTANTVIFNGVNSVDYATYTSGGILSYNEPVDITGYTARMQIRAKLTSTDFLDELTTANGKIVIDDAVYKTITIEIPATETAAYTFKTGVYSLELVNGSDVIPFIYGDITLVPEITK